ncbi:hypothetical protein [Limosilactobacillus ingluviei]|uniref:hypothetical protein n=1 Tax=Limosilactobacillus ingluviei TaxID=148604 RepID=UPI001379E8C4|nr:hypothetical protein [Limosilactobacillus ingluviei]
MKATFKTLDSSTLRQTIGGSNWDYQLGERVGRVVTTLFGGRVLRGLRGKH